MADSAAKPSTTMSMITTFAPLVIIVIIFYFLLIRPQKKKDNEAKAMRENIQIGDEIMTIGGIVGLVVKKTEDTVVIETGGDKSKLRIKIWAIQENITLTEKANAAKAAQQAQRMEMLRQKKEDKKK
ncbi:MAG: preprotein translocase subunit YajC [Oscillospiraceae bacterium]|nr:preprotein translocase subunit YajC [Oscillospiraceae bacterium]